MRFARLPSLCRRSANRSASPASLATLDDKIDLNRRMNETLEAMARAIFKSWFVDFDPVRAKMEGRQPVGMDAETPQVIPKRLLRIRLLGRSQRGGQFVHSFELWTS